MRIVFQLVGSFCEVPQQRSVGDSYDILTDSPWLFLDVIDVVSISQTCAKSLHICSANTPFFPNGLPTDFVDDGLEIRADGGSPAATDPPAPPTPKSATCPSKPALDRAIVVVKWKGDELSMDDITNYFEVFGVCEPLDWFDDSDGFNNVPLRFQKESAAEAVRKAGRHIVRKHVIVVSA